MRPAAHRLLWLLCAALLALGMVYLAAAWPAAGDALDGWMMWHDERA